MKTLHIGWIVTLMSCFALSSCDEKKVDREVLFPIHDEKWVSSGDTISFAFDASHNWRLSSSVTWASFIANSDNEQTMYGDVGANHHVQIAITEIGAHFEKEDQALIVLTMGGKEQTVLTLMRIGKKYELTVVDGAGNSINADNPLVIEYGAATAFTVTGNFTWAATHQPEWIEFYPAAVTSTNGVALQVQATIATNRWGEPAEGIISFGSATDTEKFSIPVLYDGMPEDKVAFSVAESQKWDIVFSNDGTRYSMAHQGIVGEWTAMPFSFKVYARHHKYNILYVEEGQWGCATLQPDNQWFFVSDDKAGNLSFSIDNHLGASARKGYVVVLPAGLYETHKNNLDGYLYDQSDNDNWTLYPEMDQYIAFAVNQEATRIDPFSATDASGQTLELISYDSQVGAGEANALFGTDNVWVLSLENRPYELITIRVNDVDGNAWIEATTVWNGADTKWDGVEFEGGEEWPSLKPKVAIYGVTAKASDTEHRPQMLFRFINKANRSETTHGIIIFEQW